MKRSRRFGVYRLGFLIVPVLVFAQQEPASPGSLFTPNARLLDFGRDLRASRLGDTVTILVADKASAVSSGSTNTARKSSAKTSIPAAAGAFPASSWLVNLAEFGGNQQIQGQGTTSRESALSTTLSATVTGVLPNGNLMIEATKAVTVNSERQLVTVKGLIRPFDVTTANTVRSDRIADLEIRINGKGVVADSVKRPFILYRILLGLLPF
jgi:flagellar L-ring protein precursor FlgH